MTVRLEWDGAVATVTVDRPERRNALNRATLAALGDTLDEAEGDARVVVLTGAGDAFVSGADIGEMVDLSPDGANEYAALGHAVTDRIESFPAPVIAAINGYCLGGGLELALAADLRVASERAMLGHPEIDLGIIPGWGGTQRLPELVGDELARRMIFFGERLDGTDAHELSLVGDVVAHDELDEYVADLAADLAAKPAFALQAAKEAINTASASDDAGMAFERRTWSSLFGTHDQREGMEAFLDGRDPDFD